jgi:uncharacterized membrane protein YkgB
MESAWSSNGRRNKGCFRHHQRLGPLAALVLLGAGRRDLTGVKMNFVIRILIKLGILRDDTDYHVVRASMVIIFLFFGYQKWFNYEAQALIPYISHGPLIFWLYPVFGIRGATWFLGVAEWTFGLLLLLGFWNKQLGIFGALGACFTFIATATIIPFMPDGWAPSAGGFPAMTERVAFLMKDLVLLAASFYLLRQDVLRASSASEPYRDLQDAETGRERLRRA